MCLDTRTAASAPCLRTSASRQLAVPAENRVRCRYGGHLRQPGTSQLVPEHGQTSPFLIAESQASSAQVRPQHPILFLQERDHFVPLAQDPAAQGPDEPLERRHGRILRQPRSIQFWDSTRVSVNAQPVAVFGRTRWLQAA